MGSKLIDKARDKALDYVIQHADRAVYCNGEPSSYSNADTLISNGGVKVAERGVALSTGDFSKAAGDTSGRKLTLNKGGYVAQESDNIDHVAILDDSNSEILAIMELDDGNGSAVSVTKGLAYNQAAVDVEVRAAQTT